MTAMIVGLLICLVLSVAVMALVAIPARRDGREVLTSRGERVVVKVRARADSATTRGSGAPAGSAKRGGTKPTKRKAS